MSDLDLRSIKAGLCTDGAYVASAKRDLIALVAEVEKLRAENARLERLLGGESFPTSDGYESAMQALADARARVTELETALGEVLRCFYEKGYPGFEASRSCWVRVESLTKWRRVAARGSDV